jgi:hypothetical protein
VKVVGDVDVVVCALVTATRQIQLAMQTSKKRTTTSDFEVRIRRRNWMLVDTSTPTDARNGYRKGLNCLQWCDWGKRLKGQRQPGNLEPGTWDLVCDTQASSLCVCMAGSRGPIEAIVRARSRLHSKQSSMFHRLSRLGGSFDMSRACPMARELAFVS